MDGKNKLLRSISNKDSFDQESKIVDELDLINKKNKD
jgi:hypothetical protein